MPILTSPIPLILRCQNDDGVPTKTSEIQADTENLILDLYSEYKDEVSYSVAPEGEDTESATSSLGNLSDKGVNNDSLEENVESTKKDRSRISLSTSSHRQYLLSALSGLPWGFQILDASKPFMIYWMVHSLDMMGYEFTSDMKQRIISTLKNHIHPCGGFRGGSAQLPHLAPTFAGVSTLAILKEPSGFEMIDREKFREFLLSVKTEDGSFRMCHDGEIDVRGTYCALVTASLLNILDEEISRGAAEFALRCQTYEGGIAGYPYTEAHGGYTFCGLAALEILGRVGDLDFGSLMQWLASRQLTLEGGFSGRTNKLVDGCYSFWVGGCFGIVEAELTRRGEKWGGGYLFDREALQEYILICCQGKKGLRDKPGKSPDYYHTCYCLSGLSVAQHQLEFIQSPSIGRSPTSQPNTKTIGYNGHYKVTESKELIIGKKKKNRVKPIHPVYNVSLEAVNWAKGLWIGKGEIIRSLC